MKSRTKANIIVSLITLVIVLAMMAPVLSVFVKIDNGIHLTADIELGEEAIFEVDGNTPKDSLVTNLSNSYDRGGRFVEYGTKSEEMVDSSDASDIADRALASGETPITVKDVDGNIVRVYMVDESTDDDKIITMTIRTSELAAKYTIPKLKLYFEKGEFTSMTDSRVDVNKGTIKMTISIPMASFLVMQAMGCNVVMCFNIEYLFLMSYSMTGDLGNMTGTDATISIGAGVETVTVSMGDASSAVRDAMKGIDGSEINGVKISSKIVGDNATISFDLKNFNNLSSALKDMLDRDGKITFDYDGSTFTVESDQAKEIIKLLEHLEGVVA